MINCHLDELCTYTLSVPVFSRDELFYMGCLRSSSREFLFYQDGDCTYDFIVVSIDSNKNTTPLVDHLLEVGLHLLLGLFASRNKIVDRLEVRVEVVRELLGKERLIVNSHMILVIR
jgi:hypothetical protein